MWDSFTRSLSKTLEHEGGYSNNPADPGGPTMKGITLKTYSSFLGRAATVDELKSIPNEHLEDIYNRHYWMVCNCDELPVGIDACVFDFAVNSGPGRAAKTLQALVGSAQDGQIGPKTINAAHSWVAAHGLKNAVRLYQHERQEYLEKLKTFPIFGKGWTRRVNSIQRFAEELIDGAA